MNIRFKLLKKSTVFNANIQKSHREIQQIFN